MIEQSSKQVIVLGMHRSGTSILSKVLIQLGVNMGSGDYIGGVSNIDGHNEDSEMLSINESILAKLNSTWDNPPDQSDILELHDFISDQYQLFCSKRKGFWGVKEPRLSLFASIFNESVSNPKYIYIVRHEDDVSKSLSIRDGISIEKGKEIKRIYDERIIEFLLDKPHLKLQYEDLISKPNETLVKICDFIEEYPDEKAISHIKGKDDLKTAKKDALNKKLKVYLSEIVKEPKIIFTKNNWINIKSGVRRMKDIYLNPN